MTGNQTPPKMHLAVLLSNSNSSLSLFKVAQSRNPFCPTVFLVQSFTLFICHSPHDIRYNLIKNIGNFIPIWSFSGTSNVIWLGLRLEWLVFCSGASGIVMFTTAVKSFISPLLWIHFQCKYFSTLDLLHVEEEKRGKKVNVPTVIFFYSKNMFLKLMKTLIRIR